MKKNVKKIIWYQCDICKTKYEKAFDVEECEARKLEEKKFKVGDWVQAIEERSCDGRRYMCEGIIVEIVGPEPADYEYEVKWLGGDPERLNSHVWLYEIEYKCPHCEENKRVRYYAPEIRKIN